jgi:hypothetical protein
VDGVLVQGDPSIPKNVAAALNLLIGDGLLREEVAVNGQRTAVERFLVFAQLSAWMTIVLKLRTWRERTSALALGVSDEVANMDSSAGSGIYVGSGGGGPLSHHPVAAPVVLAKGQGQGQAPKKGGLQEERDAFGTRALEAQVKEIASNGEGGNAGVGQHTAEDSEGAPIPRGKEEGAGPGPVAPISGLIKHHNETLVGQGRAAPRAAGGAHHGFDE